MPTVRTTMQPHVDLDVSDTEYAELKKQGLLLEDVEPTPAAAPAKPTTLSKAAMKAKES